MLRKILRGPEQRRRTDCLPANHRLPNIYRHRLDATESKPIDPHARDAALARLEAALLLADEPLSARRLAALAEVRDSAALRRLINRLRELYDADGSAFQVEEIAGGYQLLTRPAFHPWLVRLRRSSSQMRLSAAALETLAIVAYRQPVMRADVEAVRGVQCGDLLSQLMEKGLVRIAGRHESLGRPVLYATTKKFLQQFGLNTLKDLPEIEQLNPPPG
jgi:segregation and condensation protein B